MITEIKIGRNIYQIKKGDYILDNGACLQFCSGDNRTLKQSGFDSYKSLSISITTEKKVINPILKDLEKREIKSTFSGQTFIKYYFR